MLYRILGNGWALGFYEIYKHTLKHCEALYALVEVGSLDRWTNLSQKNRAGRSFALVGTS